MSWVNFVIVRDLKLVVEAPKEIRPGTGLQQYVERTLDGEVADASEKDLLLLEKYATEGVPCIDITVNELATLIKTYSSFSVLQEISYVEHLLYWLKKMGISYEIVSEVELTAVKRSELLKEIGDFCLVCLDDEQREVVPFIQYLEVDV